MLKGFKDFIMRGNIVDLAVAVVIGTAFAALVTVFTESFINPLIKLVTGGGSTGGQFTVKGAIFTYGVFITGVITFILTAAVVYFVIVVPMNKIKDRQNRNLEVEPEAPTEVALLAEIRDLLLNQQGEGTEGRHAAGQPPAEPSFEQPKSL